MRCPACATEIRETGPLPREGVVYRCPVCRLDFVTNPDTHTLTLAPLRSPPPATPKQGLPLDDPRRTAPLNEGGANPPNLIRERVLPAVDDPTDDAKPPMWPRKGAGRARRKQKQST
jgi:hypothetical protein